LYNAKNGAELAKLDFVDTQGAKVEPESLRLKVGPGADKNTSARFGEG
jgi:hypothetical protein